MSLLDSLLAYSPYILLPLQETSGSPVDEGSAEVTWTVANSTPDQGQIIPNAAKSTYIDGDGSTGKGLQSNDSFSSQAAVSLVMPVYISAFSVYGWGVLYSSYRVGDEAGGSMVAISGNGLFTLGQMGTVNIVPATTLDGDIDDSVTSLEVASSTDFSTGNFYIEIDSEVMLVTAVSGTTWTVTRGAAGTTPAAHTNTTAVELNFPLNITHVIGLTYNAGNLKVYLNGRYMTEVTVTGSTWNGTKHHFHTADGWAGGGLITNGAYYMMTLSALSDADHAAVYGLLANAAPTVLAGSLTNATTAIIRYDSGGSEGTVDLSKVSLYNQATLGASTGSAVISGGETDTEDGTVGLTGGVSRGVLAGLVCAEGFITSINGPSPATTLTLTNAIATPEDLTAQVDYEALDDHHFASTFNTDTTVVQYYLPIADTETGWYVNGDAYSGDPVDAGDLVSFRVYIGGVIAAVADDWEFAPPGPPPNPPVPGVLSLGGENGALTLSWTAATSEVVVAEQLQVSSDGVDWADVEGASPATDTDPLDEGENRYWRVSYDDGANDPVYSNIVRFRVRAALSDAGRGWRGWMKKLHAWLEW